MAMTFGKNPLSQGPRPAQQTGTQPLPSYYPPPGELYGTNPALLNIAMRRYLLEQSKRAQPGTGVIDGGTNTLGSGLASPRPRLGAGVLGGGLNTGTRLGTGSGLLGSGLRSTGPMPNTGMGHGGLRQNSPLLAGRTAMLSGPQNGAMRAPVQGMVRFQDSRGGIHDIPHENLGKALQRDPGLRVLGR
ncbi:MAG TPA: hypothetical protein VK738_04445 [Terriglobales bacterium]|jgi:hypothetical protein|nr:hypothetical protein [Terriglobales bacterium]